MDLSIGERILMGKSDVLGPGSGSDSAVSPADCYSSLLCSCIA